MWVKAVLVLLMSVVCLVPCVMGSPTVDPSCPSLDACDLSCQFGYHIDSQGCYTCACEVHECYMARCAVGSECLVFNMTDTLYPLSRCVDPTIPRVCQYPMDMGPCKASLFSWYYDFRSDSCEMFVYGGCQGNDNRFATRAECELACREDHLERTEECGYKLCHLDMDCFEFGFKTDALGCEICECNLPPPPPPPSMPIEPVESYTEEVSHERAGCTQHVCTIDCQYGYVVDDDGCTSCQCINSDPDVTVFCEDSPYRLETCGLLCPYGLQRDERGCSMCACRPPPYCAAQQLHCQKVCPFGYMKDTSGCDTCTCLGLGECDHTWIADTCTWPQCTYGYDTDEAGCDVCMCRDDPCLYIDCPLDDSYCELYNTSGRVEGRCVAVRDDEQMSHNCPNVMCAMYCEHGYQVNELGCPVCRCVAEECPEVVCEHSCQFGYMCSLDGCHSCQCAPDPCHGVTCGDGLVCDASVDSDSSSSSSSPSSSSCMHHPPPTRCIAHADVKSVSVQMQLAPNPPLPEPIDTALFIETLKQKLSFMMKVQEKCINQIQLLMSEANQVQVSFLMVKESNSNLVDVYQRFANTHYTSSGPVIVYGGAEMMSRKESLAVQYSSRDPVSYETMSEPRQKHHYLIYIAGAAVLLIITTIILTVVTCKRKKRTRTYVRAQQNIIYKPAATSDRYQIKA